MPPWISKLVEAINANAQRVPWKRVLEAGQVLLTFGKRFRDNTTERERADLDRLIRKAAGDPRKLTAKQRERIRFVVIKGVTGKRPAKAK